MRCSWSTQVKEFRGRGELLPETNLLATCAGGHYLPARALPLQANKEKRDVVFEMCVVLCESLIGMPCGRLLPPLRQLCALGIKYGCKYACRSTSVRVSNCDKVCDAVDIAQCYPCCLVTCKDKFSRLLCYKRCDRRSAEYPSLARREGMPS